MDGVLCSFDERISEIAKKHPEMKESKNKFWRVLSKNYQHVYRNLPPMSDMTQLMTYLKALNILCFPKALSSILLVE